MIVYNARRTHKLVLTAVNDRTLNGSQKFEMADVDVDLIVNEFTNNSLHIHEIFV